MTRRSGVGIVCTLVVCALALACSDDSPPSGSAGAAGDAGAPPEDPDRTTPPRQLCGAPGEDCCGPPLPACVSGATCQAAADTPGGGTCAPEPTEVDVTALCRSDLECPRDTICCLSGAFGTCVRVDGNACPLPDLTLAGTTAPQARLGIRTLEVDERGCLPAQGCTCAVETGCTLGSGTRRVLEVDPLPLNVGTADLLLGNPESSPLYARDSCSRRPFLEHYLRYELLDESGAVTLSHDSRLEPRCSTSDEQRGLLGAQFQCDQQGLGRGLSSRIFEDETFGLESTSTFGGNECPFLDVSEVPAGRYEVRVTINPERVIAESRYDNNAWSFSVELPSFDDPLQPCPTASSLLFRSSPPECGWRAAPIAEPSCSPGARVELGCGSCAGDPIARVCAGDTPCSRLDALPIEPSSSSCPRLAFTCPDIGRYNVLLTSSYFNNREPPEPDPFSCDLVPPELGEAGGLP